MHTYPHKIKNMADIASFNHQTVEIKKALRFSLFLLSAFLPAVIFLLPLYFNEIACAGQVKAVSIALSGISQISNHDGKVNFIHGRKDLTQTQKRSLTKAGGSKSAKHSLTNKGGRSLVSARLTPAVVLFCALIIVSILSAVYYLNIKTGSSTKSFYSCASSLPIDPSISQSGAHAMEIGGHDLCRLRERVKEVFERVQQSWCERELSRAENYMSRRFFYRQHRRLEELISAGERNMITNIEIIDVKILGIKNGGDSGAEYMKALIKFSMIDYTVNESSGLAVRGDEYIPAESSEAWIFVSADNGWIVDEVTAA